MKKFIFMMVAMISMAMSMNAQSQSNYAGSSKFTDNWSVSLQGGVLTTLDNFYSGHTAMAPVISLSADKYINPWFGVGVDARALIGTGKVGEARFNTHTALDALNLSGYVKFNVLNMFKYDGTRRFFEPVAYTGLGWGHSFCQCSSVGNMYVGGFGAHMATNPNDYLTYRAGVELNFNLGQEKAWAIVVNPSVVWGDICNARLVKQNGNFEITAGVVYHFKTSNGTRTIAKAKLYDQAEVDALNAKINELQNRPATVVEKVVEKPVIGPDGVQKTWVVTFPYNSSELSAKDKAELDKVGENSLVVIDAYASKEPKSNEEYNLGLSQARANAVKAYLENRGVKVAAANFHGCDDDFGRVAVVTMK